MSSASLNTTVYVSGLNANTTEQGLREFFSSCGQIKSIERTNADKSNATIVFENPSSVKPSLRLGDRTLDNAVIQVRISSTNPVLSISKDIVDVSSTRSVPEEILNNINPPSFPPHELSLKVGAVVIVLRDLSIPSGLRNGARLLIKDMQPHVLLCVFMDGSHAGTDVLIPKLKLLMEYRGDFSVNFYRYQFPVRLADKS